MTKAMYVFAGAAILTTAVACGGSGSGTSLTVRGIVSPAARTLDDARVMAISPAGKTYWAYLDANGAFAVNVPTGHAYRILVANATRTGALRTIGHLQIQTSHGASTWLGARNAGLVDLGTLKVAGASAGTITTKDGEADLGGSSSADPSSGDGHHDDFDSHEDDGEDKSVCKGDDAGDRGEDDVDVEAEDGKDPGDRCDDKGLDDGDSDHDGVDDKDEEDTKMDKPCGTSGDGASSSSGGSGASSGGASGSGTPTPPPPPPAGTVAPGGACSVNADCSGIAVACIASTCTVVVR